MPFHPFGIWIFHSCLVEFPPKKGWPMNPETEDHKNPWVFFSYKNPPSFSPHHFPPHLGGQVKHPDGTDVHPFRVREGIEKNGGGCNGGGGGWHSSNLCGSAMWCFKIGSLWYDDMVSVSKNRGKTPKRDGENHGKAPPKNGMICWETHYFRKRPYGKCWVLCGCLCQCTSNQLTNQQTKQSQWERTKSG